MLAWQGSTVITNLQTATLVYNSGTGNSVPVYNTLSTPGGGQYKLVLPDSTKVWLNASSSIRFPSAFRGSERSVTVTGEAYFEVAKNAAMPFIVAVKGVQVRVLGTHFNIMAYDDESSLNTTLLEGSVKVMQGEQTSLLLPGQESKISREGNMVVVRADMDEVMAWKNGWFQFRSYDMKKVMRQISRWYNVEIAYEGIMPTRHFSGMVSRENSIGQVLRIMQAGGVGYRIAGRKITVYSNPVH